jgi:hypothetical protein
LASFSLSDDAMPSVTGTDVVIFKIFLPKNLTKNCRILLKLQLVFLQKHCFFRKTPISAKDAKNCDHNIDPWQSFTVTSQSQLVDLKD